MSSLCAAQPGRSPPVQVEGRNVTSGGVPLFFKGVAWSPFNVSTSPNLGHRPQYAAFATIDAQLMQSAGINVARTYEAISDTAVLDTLWYHGVGVIMTVFLDAGYSQSASTATTAVCAVKSHPAVLMWAVANEPNYYSVSSSYLSDIATVVTAVKAADATRPVAVVWGEVPTASVLSALPQVDVWAFNVYRGSSFGTLWSEWPAVSEKPFFLGEYGTDSHSNGADTFSRQALEVTQMATEVVDNAAVSGVGPCVGGVLFSFADEWWKYSSGTADAHDGIASWTAGGGYADLGMQEEHFGIVTVFRAKKSAYHAYAAVVRPGAASLLAPPWAPPLPPAPPRPPVGGLPHSVSKSSRNQALLLGAIGGTVGALALLGVARLIARHLRQKGSQVAPRVTA